MVLSLVGNGEIQRYQQLVNNYNLNDYIEFHGLLPNKDIIPLMSKHDIVIVPTRSEYAEGMPGTIYQALASATPLIVSNNKSFVRMFKDNEDVLTFRSGSSKELSEKIYTLLADQKLYRSLSKRSHSTFECIRLSTFWGSLLDNWLMPTESSERWFKDRCLMKIVKFSTKNLKKS